LRVHPVYRAPDLVDHRQNLTLCPSNQRRKPVKRYGEPEKRPADAHADRDQEDRESEVSKISERESENHREEPSHVRST
jgi:hypothetical protein